MTMLVDSKDAVMPGDLMTLIGFHVIIDGSIDIFVQYALDQRV